MLLAHGPHSGLQRTHGTLASQEKFIRDAMVLDRGPLVAGALQIFKKSLYYTELPEFIYPRTLFSRTSINISIRLGSISTDTHTHRKEIQTNSDFFPST